jgi:hypothetical protein
MKMTKLDHSNINFLSNTNFVFVSRESEDVDSRISEIPVTKLLSTAYYHTRENLHVYKTEVKSYNILPISLL